MKNQFQGGGGGGSVLKNQFEGGGWGGSELSDQLLDPDVPTLASQDKLKVSPKGLPFVIGKYPRAVKLNLFVYRALLACDLFPRHPRGKNSSKD